MKLHFIGKVIGNEATGGCLLLFATALALVVENSFLQDAYHAFLHFEVYVGVMHDELLRFDMHMFVNDLLMAIFFLLIGLEIKHEFKEGHLSNMQAATMPFFAALAGMAVPAIIFLLFNAGDSETISGWAIPAATDIAFAVGILVLLGKRVPPVLKVFLLAVAVLDDLGAILVIALFYTSELRFDMLGYAAACLVALLVCNWLGVYRRSAYVLLGVGLWYFVLLSGIHATIAGVLLALTIPIRVDHANSWLTRFGFNIKAYYAAHPPAHRLKMSLDGWVTFLILPLFAFTNAGVPFATLDVGNPTGITLGVAIGLFLGKIIGVFGACAVMFTSGFAKLPDGCRLVHYLGIAMLCGIGFTMSLFIASLSYDSHVLNDQARLGILVGSFFSAVCGYVLLYRSLPKNAATV